MALRGSNISAVTGTSAATFDVTLPGGCVAGDLAIACAASTAYNGSGLDMVQPAGWTVQFSASYDILCISKVLNSGDISTGTVTITNNGLGPYDATIGVQVSVGAPVIREVDTASAALIFPCLIPSSGSVVSGDGAVAFGFSRTFPFDQMCPKTGAKVQSSSAGVICASIQVDGITTNGVYNQGFSTPLGGGMYAVMIILESAGFTPAPSNILCGSPPDGTTGTPYSHTFPTNNLSCTKVFSISSGSLPTGLTLNSSTGVVSGTPTLDGVYPFQITVAYGGQFGYPGNPLPFTVLVNCSITIGTSALSIICNNPPDGQVGIPYSHALVVTGGTPPYVFSITAGSLPPGLTITTDTGVINGTPTTAGIFTFTVMVTDAMGAFVSCTITINTANTGSFSNVYTLKDYKLTDDDYGQIFPYYVTYFAPTPDQEQALQLGGGRKLLAYLAAFIESNSYLYLGCNLTVTFYCDTLLNPWGLTVSRTLPPNAIFDMECGGASTQGQRIAVKFESTPFDGKTDNALNLQTVRLWMKPATHLPVRGSAK